MVPLNLKVLEKKKLLELLAKLDERPLARADKIFATARSDSKTLLGGWKCCESLGLVLVWYLLASSRGTWCAENAGLESP